MPNGMDFMRSEDSLHSDADIFIEHGGPEASPVGLCANWKLICRYFKEGIADDTLLYLD